MGAQIIGFFGSIVAAVVTFAMAAAGITFFVIAWKAGVLPEMVGWVGTLIGGFFRGVVAFFGFLGDLLSFARS